LLQQRLTAVTEVNFPMNKSFFLPFVLLISLTCAGAAGSFEKTGGAIKPPAGLHDITIFYSNDVRGETEPCG
jgi:hypothetical protein